MTDGVANCGVDDVIITDELDRRHSRPPDYQVESQALATLAETMADKPEEVLERLAELAMQLTRSDSAGISLFEAGGEHGLLRWVAATGAFAQNLGGTIPREASPCGEVIARDEVLLVNEAERLFPDLLRVEPKIYENLLAPFHLDGKPAGTVWAIKHSPSGQFEREDARILQSLARFASTAQRVVTALQDAQSAHDQVEQRARERFRAEAALQQSETRFRTLFNSMGEAFYLTEVLFDGSGEAVDIIYLEENPAAVALVGMQSRGRRLSEINPDFDQSWLDIMAKVAKSGEPQEFERRSDFDNQWLSFHIFKPEGATNQVAVILQDVTARHRAEAAVRESEQRFRLMADTVPQIIWITDAAGRVEFFNKQWRDYVGFAHQPTTAAELVESFVHPEDQGKTMQAVEEAQRTGTLLLEHRVRSAPGDYRWFMVRAEPYRDSESGAILRWFGVSLDIHDRKLAEAALRESEERYRLIVENARDYAIIITDPDDVIVEWMPGAEAIFGWTREEAIGQSAAITFTPRDRAEGAPEWEIQTAAREGVAPDVRWHQCKDGSQVFIEGSVTPLRNEDGSVRNFLKIGQDVSERRNAQEALEASERRMRTLVTGIPQLVFRANSLGERSWASPQWTEYTGLSFDRSLGLGWLEAMHPDDRERTLGAWNDVAARGEYYSEHRIRNAATGEYRWHQSRAIPLRDGEGRVLEWLGTETEVEELRRLQRHQQVLLAELQHRVRNTLGIVRSIVRRTAQTSGDVEEMATHLDGRLGAFSRVQTMVTRQPDAGVDLLALIEDELRAHAAREGESLSIEGPTIRLQPRPAESISLAVHELATNAVKYGALGAANGQIAIRWKKGQRDGAEWLSLEWEESGLDLASGEPERQGFGLELLTRTLPYDLRAKTAVEFKPEGLRFSMAVPLGPDILAE